MFSRKSLDKCLTASITAAMAFVWAAAPLAQTMDANQDQQAAIFAEQVKASLLAVEDGDRDAPRDHWDPQFVVDEIGIDPADLLAWEKANVAFVPYLGALRGAEGVLMDRVGNSLDQALLLATLLADAGYPVRLAHADLSPEATDGLWSALAAARTAPMTADNSAAVTASETSGGASLLEAADLYGMDPVAVGKVIDGSNEDAARMFVDLVPEVGNSSVVLAGILGPIGSQGTAADVISAARTALSDHWWVEYQDNGTWLGADPMPPAASGALVPAPATFDPAALPDAFEQTVTVRVIAEQLKDGALNQKVVLEQAVRPRDLLGVTMGFRHFPMAWPEDWPQMTPDDVQIKLRAALYAQVEWLPVLTLGDAVLGSAGVMDTGDLDPSPHPVNPFMQMTTAMIGMVTKATDVLATGGDPDQVLAADAQLDTPRPPRPEGELVSERLEFIINRPGAEPIVASRDIFNLIGQDLRAKGDLSAFKMSGQKALDRSMAMLAESEIQVLASKLDPDFLIHIGAQSALGNKPVLDELSKDPFGKLPSNYMELFSKLSGLPFALYSLASLRFSLNGTSDWVFVDRPTIVLQHTRLRRAGGGDFLAEVSLDIVENGVGVDPLAADNAAALRLAQGVADTFAEAAALQQVGKVQPNVASAFATGDQPGAGWIALRPGDQPLLTAVSWPSDAKARMAQDLAAGNVVVVPAAPSAEQKLAGWWRVDPATGQTLGISASGHGQAMVEYALIIIIETMMAAAQCALEASLTKAIEKTIAERDAGAGLLDSARAGTKAGVAQAKQDVSNSSLRNRCMAMGMFAGFQSLLMGFAMHAIHTSGSGGYDGSKPSNSWERNAVNSARGGGGTAGHAGGSSSPGSASHGNGPSPSGGGSPGGASPGGASRGGTSSGGGSKGNPTIPGVAPQAGGPRGNPTLPGVAPEAGGPRGTPTEPGLGPRAPTPEEGAQTQRAPNADEAANTQRSPNADEAANTQRAPNADEMANTQRAPNADPNSPQGRFDEATQRAIDAQDKLAAHNPVDTPEGRAETNKLWNDLDNANRDRIRAWDSTPTNQRPGSYPPLPEPNPAAGSSGNGAGTAGSGAAPSGGDFSGYKTGEGPVAPPPPGQAAPGLGAKTATHEAPSSAIPDIPPPSSIPEPGVDSLLEGLKNRPDVNNGVLPPPNSNPSADSLLGGLGGGSGSGSASAGTGLGTAPTQPAIGAPATPLPGVSPMASTLPDLGPMATPQPGVSPLATTQPGISPLAKTLPDGNLPPLPPPMAPSAGFQPPIPLTEAQATRASGLAGLMDALGPVATQ